MSITENTTFLRAMLEFARELQPSIIRPVFPENELYIPLEINDREGTIHVSWKDWGDKISYIIWKTVDFGEVQSEIVVDVKENGLSIQYRTKDIDTFQAGDLPDEMYQDVITALADFNS